MSFYKGYCQKVLPRFRVAIPSSYAPIKKTLHKNAQLLRSELIPDVVKLKSKINLHKSNLCEFDI